MAALLLLSLLAQDGWEYRSGIGFVNPDTMERKSPEEFYRHALSRREAGDSDSAVRCLTLILNHVQDAGLREAAHFERAEAFYQAGHFYEAYADYEAFILRHPQSDRATTAKKMEMSAALEMARRGHKERVLGIPLISSSRTGVEYLRDALKRYPREDFSADFTQKLGMFFYDRGDWDAAENEFSLVVGNPDRGIQAQYADYPEAVLALYMLGRTSEQRFSKVDRDIKPLKDARRQYERFIEEADRLRRLPDPARKWVDGLIGAVRERLAKVYEIMLRKQLLTAEYYDWKGFPRSAAIHYRSLLKDDSSFRRVLKDFPETEPARKAREWLAAAGLPSVPDRAAAGGGVTRRMEKDKAGWTLLVEKAGPRVRFVLLSTSPEASVEEAPDGTLRVKAGDRSLAAVRSNEGILVVDGKGRVGFHPFPEGWDADLVQEYRDARTRRPDLAIKDWLEDRLKRHPAPSIDRLERE
jgi:outer membrane protein assembly factor BamD (BamD/ComL family)